MSGPLLDRIELHIQVPPVSPSALLEKRKDNNDHPLRECETAAQARQWARRGKLNRGLTAAELECNCALLPAAGKPLERAAKRLGLTARALHRLLRVARTLADLADRGAVLEQDLLRAGPSRLSAQLRQVPRSGRECRHSASTARNAATNANG